MFGHHHHHHCGPIHVPGCNQTQVCPPVCHEPIQFVKENCYTVVVPHVHPVKTLEVNNVLYKNEHTYPHSYQSMNNVQNQDIQLGAPMAPAPGFGGPMAGGQGFGGPMVGGQGQFPGQGMGFGGGFGPGCGC